MDSKYYRKWRRSVPRRFTALLLLLLLGFPALAFDGIPQTAHQVRRRVLVMRAAERRRRRAKQRRKRRTKIVVTQQSL